MGYNKRKENVILFQEWVAHKFLLHCFRVFHETCILKASIHCEGCKKKVKKILTQIHGVEYVDVDTKQQKVTVIGNVNAETLINKLTKSGKHAQPWPEVKQDKKTENNSSKMKEKTTAEKPGKAIVHQQEPPNNLPSVSKLTTEQNPLPKKSQPTKKDQETAKNDDKSDSACNDVPAKNKEKICSEETENVTDDTPAKKTVDMEKKPAEDCSKLPEKSKESGEVGKKKKKKGHNRNLASSEQINYHEPGSEVGANQNIPRQHYYQPHNYYSPPIPTVYGMSYNTAHPNSNYTASYYAAPYSYAYAYPGSENESQPVHGESRPNENVDSFEMFSDENPNGCTVA